MALTDGILAYWNFNDNGSGGVSLVDSTGNGNTLTNNNSVTLGTGIIGGDATISKITGSYLGGLNTTFDVGDGDISISIWVNPSSYGSNGYADYAGSVFDFRNSPSSLEWLGIFSDGGNFRIFANGQLYQTTAVIPLNSWSNITISRATGISSVYINGSLDGTFSDSLVFASQLFALGGPIGSEGDPAFLHFDGGIDEVGIWSRSLSESEITQLYNSGNAKTYPFDFLYFNGAVDGDLGELGNWWKDSGFTTPATTLPTSIDGVYISAAVTTGTETYGSATITANIGSAVSITATTTITDAVNSGAITGATRLNGAASNAGTIIGNVTLRNRSTNSGTITGNATVYYDNGDGTKPIGGIVEGTITYIGFPIKKAWFSSVASGTFDEDFNTIANWWTDSQLTIPANNLPSEITDIVIVSYMSIASGSPVVNSITIPNGGSTGFITLTATNGVYIIGGQTNGTTFYTSGGSVVEDSVGFISRLLKLPWFINI